jgi:hypothetical protein
MKDAFRVGALSAGKNPAVVQGLWDAGATHVFVPSGQQDQPRVIDFFGKQVLPQLVS